MPAFIALLRGVNMAGHRKLAMSELRALAEGLDFEDVQTLLQSGNLAFRSARRSAAALEALLEGELKQRLRLETRVMLRTAAEWHAIVAGNPFPGEARTHPSRLAVVFLKDKPVAKAIAALTAAHGGPEQFQVRGRELYAFYPDGFARTKFTTALIDRKLETIGTGRNWNTVLKLERAASGLEDQARNRRRASSRPAS